MHDPVSPPVQRLKTNRGWLKTILLGILTLCIYPIFSRDINTIAGQYDGKKTRPLILVILWCLPFVLLSCFAVWHAALFTWLNLPPLQLDWLPADLHWAWSLAGLVPLCLGLLIWGSRISARIGTELRRRQLPYRFGAGTFWGWEIFGTLLVCIGPLVYLHKLCRAMNILSADYNING